MTDDEVVSLLAHGKNIAVVGFSLQPKKPSFYVSLYMHNAGYRILPVNPTVAGQPSGIGAEPVYDSVAQAKAACGGKIDIVNVFRRSDQVGTAVTQAIEAGAGCVWMQRGIENDGEACRARASGLGVVMDKCIKLEHMRLMG
jgi:predicted CoA-binding protein